MTSRERFFGERDFRLMAEALVADQGAFRPKVCFELNVGTVRVIEDSSPPGTLMDRS